MTLRIHGSKIWEATKNPLDQIRTLEETRVKAWLKIDPPVCPLMMNSRKEFLIANSSARLRINMSHVPPNSSRRPTLGARYQPMTTASRWSVFRTTLATCALWFLCASVTAAETEWTELVGDRDFKAWSGPKSQWYFAKEAKIDPENPKRLKGEPGSGVMINGETGKTNNITTKQEYGDVDVHLEFLIPKGSNSGIKLEEVYEIQIYDSWESKKPLSGSDCGGVYPRAELKPKYHHIDEGYAPKVNASRPPGEWQTLDISFQAPRIGPDGKKVANARFLKVSLNGKTVHEDLEVPTPTGNNWRKPERAKGPILLQADHGPVALRNIRVRSR